MIFREESDTKRATARRLGKTAFDSFLADLAVPMSTVWDGNLLLDTICSEIHEQVERCARCRRRCAAYFLRLALRPCFALMWASDLASDNLYVNIKRKACERAGMVFREVRLPLTTSTTEFVAAVDSLNADSAVHGIFVQLPLPEQIDTRAVLEAVRVDKDVDGARTGTVGSLLVPYGGEKDFRGVSAAPLAALEVRNAILLLLSSCASS